MADRRVEIDTFGLAAATAHLIIITLITASSSSHSRFVKMATAGPSSQPDMPGRALAEKNLLDHVNKIRQTPTFVGLEQVLRMTGDDWIESMIEQAKDIRSKWA